MKKIHRALIGCGRIGFLLENDPLRYKPCTHYGGSLAAGLPVTCACDIDAERLDKFSKTAGIPREYCFAGHTELLETMRPEIVIIATWTDSHEEICVHAARNGARVIVLEKPVAPTLAGAERIIRECSTAGAVPVINHERRYDSRYRKLKSLLDKGKIGRVKTVNARMLTAGHRGASSPGQGGGPLLHDGTHLVDIIRFLFGDITTVTGEFTRESRTSGYEDRAAAWLKTESGIDIFLEAGGSRSYFVFELEISGTEGRVIIGNGYERLYTGRKSKLYTGFRDLEETDFPSFRSNNCFTELYRESGRLRKSRNTIPISTGRDGMKALEVIHAVYLSSHLNRQEISLPIDPGEIDLNAIFSIS